MDIENKTENLLNLIKDNHYFNDLNYYMRQIIETGNLSYDNLEYIYNKMYKNKSLFIKQNIYPVSQFLIKGYSTKEAEELAKLLPDAYDLSNACYSKKEKGNTFNKLYDDLEYVYMKYDYYKNINNTKNKAYEIVKDDIEITSVRQRKIELEIKKQILCTKTEMKEVYRVIDAEMKELIEQFRKSTIGNEKLREHFKNDDPKYRFSSIQVATAILGGIELRNRWRENGKLDGRKEEFPYNEEQIKMIDKYNRWQKTIDKLEYYAEFVFEDEDIFEDEEEKE